MDKDNQHVAGKRVSVFFLTAFFSLLFVAVSYNAYTAEYTNSVSATATVALAQTATGSANWLSDDFIVVSVLSDPFATEPQAVDSADANIAPASCRANIAKVVCLVNPTTNWATAPYRKCQPTTTNYAAPIEKAYDVMPVSQQKMFCHLKRIFIEKQLSIGTAYAMPYVSKLSGAVLGGIVGMRQSVLDNPYSLDTVQSWKEQLNFGNDPSVVSVKSGMPVVKTSTTRGQTDLLYYIFSHEFGHLFDFANNLNNYGTANSFSNFSWTATSSDTRGSSPLPNENFRLRSSLCYYACAPGAAISPTKANQNELYRTVVGSSTNNFVSIYASKNPREDLAETFATRAFADQLKTTFTYNTSFGQTYDAIAHYRSAALAGKRSFVDNFFKTKYRYPGQ